MSNTAEASWPHVAYHFTQTYDTSLELFFGGLVNLSLIVVAITV